MAANRMKRTLDEDIDLTEGDKHTGAYAAEEYAAVTMTSESNIITPEDWDPNFRFNNRAIENAYQEINKWNLLDTKSKNILYSLSKGFEEPDVFGQANFLINVLIHNYSRKYGNTNEYAMARDWITLMITSGVKKGYKKTKEFNSSQNSANTERLASAQSILCSYLKVNDREKICKLNDMSDTSSVSSAAAAVASKKKIHPLHETKLFKKYHFLLEIGKMLDFSTPLDLMPLSMSTSIQKRLIIMKESKPIKTALVLNSRKIGIATFDRSAVGKYPFDFIKSHSLNEYVTGVLKNTALRYELSAGTKIDLAKDELLVDGPTIQVMTADRDTQIKPSEGMRFGAIAEFLIFKEKSDLLTRCYTRVDFYLDRRIFLSEEELKKIIEDFPSDWVAQMNKDISEYNAVVPETAEEAE